jgi:hypothetical protein
MKDNAENVFQRIEDWLDHLNRYGEVYESPRSMIAENPKSVADLPQGLPENTVPLSRKQNS